jgi:hypothetical protein
MSQINQVYDNIKEVNHLKYEVDDEKNNEIILKKILNRIRIRNLIGKLV